MGAVRSGGEGGVKTSEVQKGYRWKGRDAKRREGEGKHRVFPCLVVCNFP